MDNSQAPENMNRFHFLVRFSLIAVLAAPLSAASLSESFQNPPHEAKPHTWYHFMSGNISREGITEDLEAMADAGIGGIILFNVTIGIPNGPVEFNSPEHIELTAFTAAECQRLGLSFGIHNCDGWTSSGGPWVPVEHSMKRVVHREIVIDGGSVNLRLPSPTMRGDFYRDIAVVAYPSLDSEIQQSQYHPLVTSSAPGFNPHIATNGKIDERSELPVSEEGTAWIQWDFGKPFTARSFYLNTEKQRPRGKYFLQTSDDGRTFTNALELQLLRHGKYEYSMDHSFPPLTARYFRFVTEKAMDLAEVELSATRKFTQLNGRLNIGRQDNNALPPLEPVEGKMAIPVESIVDLTSQVDADGRLKTELPKGKWTVMRFGYTTTAAINDPASLAGTGWEVDKFSRQSFQIFWDGYVKNAIDAVRKTAPGALQYVEIDSYEVGGQNWTSGYEDEFKDRIGYGITKFLPLYAGRYVEDATTTENVLWDIRRLNSELMCENYFDAFDMLCEQEGLKSILEPYGNGPFNQLDAARKADIPMGEFHASSRTLLDSAISAGHIYGRNIISAEAFTSGPQTNFEAHPGQWKPIGDRAWALGVNEFVFHTYAHQANTKVKPGMTMNGFGAQINRNQTWWETAGKSWFEYVARGQHLLRQGVPVSDLLVFVGDGAPSGVPKRRGLNDLPNSINYDGVNADVLINRISVKNGKLVLPEGTRYHALVIKNSRETTLPTLRRINELSEQGALIIGSPPQKLGGHTRSTREQKEFESLVSKLWSRSTTTTETSWERIYADYNLPIDLKIENGEAINYAHRRTETEDIYFFYNPEEQSQSLRCLFNIAGKRPELWDPVSGESTYLDTFTSAMEKTEVAIPMAAHGAAFVVFRDASDVASSKANPVEMESFSVDGPWQVTFPDLKDGSKTLSFDSLQDWTAHSLESIKHYSGTAVYEKTLELDKSQFTPNRRLSLDLGAVHVAARVFLNGKEIGTLWTPPFALDITEAAREGENRLRIEIVNQWANRLIGDEALQNISGYDLVPFLRKPLLIRDPQLSLINEYKMLDWYTANEPAPLGERSTFTTYPFYSKKKELLPAGLLGPVQVMIIETNTEVFD